MGHQGFIMHPLIQINEEFVCFASITNRITKHLWPDEPVDFLLRRVISTLRTKPPMTISDLARGRGVTRQRARQMVATLTVGGFILMETNPAHKTAKLIKLTERGRDYIDGYNAKVKTFLQEGMNGKVSNEELQQVLRVIRKVRPIFDAWLLDAQDAAGCLHGAPKSTSTE